MKTRLGRVEQLVLGLLTIHNGIEEEQIAEELCRPVSQIIRIVTRLEDKGFIDASRQPTSRPGKQPTQGRQQKTTE